MSALPAGCAAAAAWARVHVRARWRSLIALGTLVAAIGGMAAASVAGARRTHTSFERLRERTHAADAIVFPGQVGVFSADWTALRDRPEVVDLARWTLSFGRMAGDEEETVLFAPSDDRWLHDVDRPVVVDGRMFDPAAPDEVVVGEAATGLGLGVGSVVEFTPFAAGQNDTGGEPPSGPQLRLTVVGVVRHVHEFVFVPGMIMPSPAFLDQHRGRALLVENAMVRLADGAADVPALQRAVNDLVAPGTPVDDLHVIQRRVDTTLGVERAALLLLGAAIAFGGLVLVGQALGRSTRLAGEEVGVLRAMGFDRSAVAACPSAAHLLVALVGAVGTVAVALVASRWFPIGLASKIDPDRGVHADWLVLGPAAVVAVAVVTATAAINGWRLTSAARRQAQPPPSPVLDRLTRSAPLTVGLGASLALPRADRSGELARPALAGAIVGVLGVVATVTVDRGLDEALANPVRAGVSWDASAVPAMSERTATGIAEERVRAIASLPVVASAGVVSRWVSEVDGTGVPIFSVTSADGSIALASTSGRAPSGEDEAAIGPRTARQLGVAVGDTVTVGSRGRRVRIVGEALFPSDVHAGFDEGLWLTPHAFDEAEPLPAADDLAGPTRVVAIRFRPGADPQAALAEVARAQGDAVVDVLPVEVPPELENLRNVRTLPRLLASFLALFATAAVGLVLGASVRRRRRDLATLRALGMTRRGLRAILNMQGSVIALVGLVLGVPLGVALGRIGWRLVTDRVPLDYVAPLALPALAVLVPAAVVLANLLAVWPGRRAARLRPAEVLRAE